MAYYHLSGLRERAKGSENVLSAGERLLGNNSRPGDLLCFGTTIAAISVWLIHAEPWAIFGGGLLLGILVNAVELRRRRR